LTAGHGRVAWLRGLTGGAVAPSEQPCFYDPGILARSLTTAEIERLVQGFGIAAKTAKSAGIDAVELHGHCGYLIDQFMTPIWNRRKDRYGGDLEGRLRFSREIVENIKANAGRDFPVIFRMSVEHYFPGGREMAESLEIASYLEKSGVDALNVNVGCYDAVKGLQYPAYDPPGGWAFLSETVRKSVNIPVITAGRLGYPEIAEKILREDKADFIGLGRALLADPEWPNKVQNGKTDDILTCIGCNDCMHAVSTTSSINCALNPLTGREKDLAITPCRIKKSVLVIGGGPAGMEAAMIAALRGHAVTLWEKSGQLGGSLIPLSVPDFKLDFKLLKSYLSGQIEKLGVKIELGIEATPEMIQRMDPEVLIIAVGAKPVIPDIPGINKKSIITAFDALSGKKRVGERIAVLGGGLIGCETALYLSQKGKEVAIIEPGEALAPNEFEFNRKDLLWVLNNGGVRLLTNTRPVEVTYDGLVIDSSSGKRSLKTDTVVLAAGFKSEVGLLRALEEKGIRYQPVGDCVVPRNKMKAVIWSGFYAARSI
jgi:2-enoate reductase